MGRDESNKKFWERAAFLYTPSIAQNRAAYQAVCSILSDYLSQDMSVLELACGTGQLTFPLAPKVRAWEATDFSEQMVAQTRKRSALGNLTFSVQDATHLPYADHSFDAVVIANALHIMPDPDAAIAEIRRVLRPDGLLFAPTYVYEAHGLHFKVRLMELIGFRTFHKWSSRALCEYIQGKGFAILDQQLVQSKLLPECVLVVRK